MSRIYQNSKIWLTIDIEEITDTNFNILWKKQPKIDYEKLLESWIDFCDKLGVKSTCFVLGSFAKKYPKIIRKLHERGHEIASHGLTHKLVYEMQIEEWKEELIESKKILEEIIGDKVYGYRSPSWSLPFEKYYYEILKEVGFTYSSSYFPFKTYMYGNSIDKKSPFKVGEILEIPLAKQWIPFSGGFYLRVLPLFLQKYLSKKLQDSDKKTVIYLHPYELIDKNLISFFKEYAKINKDFVLAFWESVKVVKKIKDIIS